MESPAERMNLGPPARAVSAGGRPGMTSVAAGTGSGGGAARAIRLAACTPPPPRRGRTVRRQPHLGAGRGRAGGPEHPRRPARHESPQEPSAAHAEQSVAVPAAAGHRPGLATSTWSRSRPAEPASDGWAGRPHRTSQSLQRCRQPRGRRPDRAVRAREARLGRRSARERPAERGARPRAEPSVALLARSRWRAPAPSRCSRSATGRVLRVTPRPVPPFVQSTASRWRNAAVAARRRGHSLVGTRRRAVGHVGRQRSAAGRGCGSPALAAQPAVLRFSYAPAIADPEGCRAEIALRCGTGWQIVDDLGTRVGATLGGRPRPHIAARTRTSPPPTWGRARRHWQARRTSRGARGWACAGRSSGSRAPGRPPG